MAVLVGVDHMEQVSCCRLALVVRSLVEEMEDHRNELLVVGNLAEEMEGRSRVVVVESRSLVVEDIGFVAVGSLADNSLGLGIGFEEDIESDLLVGCSSPDSTC